MRYVCIGYFDPEQMHLRPEDEIDALMAECQPHLQTLYATGRVIFDIGVSEESKTVRRAQEKLAVTDSFPDPASRTIGSVFLIEANDMDEAIHLASLHPTLQLLQGERLGWCIEIHPVHYLSAPGAIN